MATILVTHGIPAEGFAALHAHEIIIPPPLSRFTHEELLRLMPQADAVVACGALPGDVIRCGKKLRLIANYGAGYDGVDVRTATECGIFVTNLPDTVAECTAELALGLMLAVSRRIGENNCLLRQGAPEECFGMGLRMGRMLRGQTLGLIGCGRIGGRVGEMASALGMRVVAYTPSGVRHPLIQPMEMEMLLQTADIVSLHCPLTPQTRGMMGRRQLQQMKAGAMLINTARGAVVDMDALADMLACGHLSGAGLDVYPDEPHVPARLTQLPQAVLTPHIGANTQQVRTQMAQECAAQILDALAGKRPAHVLNPAAGEKDGIE